MVRKILIVVFGLFVICGAVSATTYHVAKNGSDSNDGLSWTRPWLTLGKLYQGTVLPGDTVFFGTGIWREWLRVTHGISRTQPTVYACSSFAATNGAGEYHFAKIWGSDPITNWIQHSGNIYKAQYTNYPVTMLAQGDSLFWQRQTIGEVDFPGEFYIANDTVYAYIYDLGRGYDPDNYQMEIGNRGIIHLDDDATFKHAYSCTTGSYVTIYGFEMKYARRHSISLGVGDPVINPTGRAIKNLRIEHCKLSHVASTDFSTNNPVCIYTRNVDAGQLFDSISVVACSLGYVINHAGSTHGSAITTYCTNRFVTDSCILYGYFSADAAIQYKSGYDNACVGNVVRNSLFTHTGADIGIKFWQDQYKDSAYGNVFINLTAFYNGQEYTDPPGDSLSRYFYMFNNTIINGQVTYTLGTTPEVNGHRDSFIKYNVIYRPNSGGDEIHDLYDEDSLTYVIDSNLYLIGDSLFRIGAVEYSLNDWRNRFGFDLRSRFVNNAADVGFSDVQGGDYSRPNAQQEMNLTYGGRTWTIYGAWQPGDPIFKEDYTPPEPIDDLQGEYGENHGEIKLAWTAPADSLSVRISRYEIMCSLEPLTGLPWKPTLISYDCHAPGTPESLTVSGLEPGLDYNVAIKCFDNKGLASPISNIVITFAGGIMIPPALFTAVDEIAATASLSCDTVSTYYNQITYDFILVDSSTGDIASVNLDAAENPKISALFEGLNPETVYYWHCRAVTADIDSSDWSFPKMFRLDNVYPDPPTAYSPLDMDTLVGALQALTLVVNNGTDDDSTGELSYDIELYELDASFPLADTLGLPSAKPITSWSVPVSLETSTTFRWRARSYDGLDYSFLSDWFQFTLIESSAGGNTTLPGTIIAYPNPVHFRDGEYVTFKLPDNPVDLLIQTVSGESVLLRTGISGDWQWFGENGAGNIVATGIYSWFVRGTNQSGKIVVKP